MTLRLSCLGATVLFATGASAQGIDRLLSGPFTVGYLGLGVALPFFRGERESGYRTVEAGGAAFLLGEGLKAIVRERRPDGSDLGSFPSVHASTAFAVATMASQFHPKEAPLWFLGAAAIGVSRVDLRKHSILDVLAGAALGYGTARLELSAHRGFVLHPQIGRGMGLGLTRRF